MFVQHLRKPLQGHYHIRTVCLPFRNSCKIGFLVFSASAAVQDFSVPFKFLFYNLRYLIISLFPCFSFYVLEGDENHRIFSLIIPVFFSALPDLFIFKINGCVFLCLFKKSTKHIHIQSLSKTAGTGKQGHHGPFVQKLLDHHGFVHIIIFRGSQAEIRDANWKRQICGNSVFSVCTGFDTAIQRLFGVSGNHPDASVFVSAFYPTLFAKHRYPPFCNPPHPGRFFCGHRLLHFTTSKSFTYIIPFRKEQNQYYSE